MSGKTRNNFFKEALQNLDTVGTFTYSSKYLVNKTIDPIDFSKDIVVVEFGAGNGCFTHILLDKMTPGSKLFAFELNDQFIDMIRARIDDDRLILIDETVELVDHFLKEHGIKEIDHVVCALPLVIMPEPLLDKVFEDTLKYLKPDGYFLQISYSTLKKSYLEKWFENIRVKYTIRNVPPAFSYWCQGHDVSDKEQTTVPSEESLSDTTIKV